MMAPSQRVFAGLVLLAAASLGKSQVTKIHLPGASIAFASSAATDSAGAASREVPATDPELATDATPHSPEADERLTRADAHFNAGRQFYFQGNLSGARHEFDAAVDALLNAPDSLPDHRRIERRLDELCDLIYRFDIEKLGAGQTEEAVVFDKAPIDEISHMTFPVDPNLAPRLQTELHQTASAIPLELSDPVLGYVHYFSTDKGRKILLAGLRRSGRYKDLIQRIFSEEGVPQELIYLAQAESGFLPRAVSYKKAVGMWQFIPGTGTLYNLEHTATYDERFDPEKATRAAAKFLKDLYARYGDWYLAMAAYNCGAGGVDRAVERTGYADYWELLKRHALPKETANYVPIIVAMTIMAKNPADYGLENVDVDPAVEYETIQLTADTNLNLIADATLQPVSVIRDLNPSLLRALAPAGFQIHVPKGTAESAQAALESVPAGNRQAWRLHHVETGDTLAGIAKSFHLTPERIVAVNRGADSLEAGDTLLIPAVYHDDTPHPVRARRGNFSRRTATPAALKSGKAPASSKAHIATSHRVPAQVLHRKAAVRTAALNR
ncbi:MAG TPA: transglycosylase SLT domain-containing protein [Bryobacteraceae bacterium]|nr:transglycosylase SLT domain-containing protein [Bryobacteraceae bacterium]